MRSLLPPLPSLARPKVSATDELVTLLQAPDYRRWLYRRLAGLFFVAALVAALGKGWSRQQPFELIVSDGRWSYAYLSSIIVDGDVDFTNQMREHWGADFHSGLLEHRTPSGMVSNQYPIGMALTLLPPFLVAHGASLAIHPISGSSWFVADGYNSLYQVACLAWIIFLGWWTYRFIDRLLVQHFRVSERVVGYSVLVYWVGTGYAYYLFREPFMVHVVSSFWVTACILLVAELRQKLQERQLDGWRLPGLVFTLNMALVCRPSDLFLAPFIGLLVFEAVRQKMLGPVLRQLPKMVLGFVPVAVQMVVWHELSGRWLFYSYSGETFQWNQPALWQTLFSSRHGLFFWSPILLCAALGIGWRMTRRSTKPGQPLLICYVLSFLILWYLNSASQTWWFGDSFGARAFLELSSLFVLGLATFAEMIFEKVQAGARRPVLLGLGLATVVFNIGLMALYISHKISRGDALIAGF